MKFYDTKDTPSMKDILVFLSRIGRTKLILALLVGNCTASWVIWGFLNLVAPDYMTSFPAIDSEFYNSMPLKWRIAFDIIFAPFLETLIFHFILLLILKKCSDWITKSNSWTYPFFITSLLFAAAHVTNYGLNYYGLLHSILIIPAFLFTILAIVEIEKEKGHPILSVWILHGLSNLLFTLEELFLF